MINSLQFLRFVFAMMIFHHHYFTQSQIESFGAFPVAFFFMLSGYVMARGYADKIASGKFQKIAFYQKRLLRILPLNTIGVFLALLLPICNDFLTGELHSLKYILAIPDLLLIQSWFPVASVYFSGNMVAWFCADILFCYFVFPFVIQNIYERNPFKTIAAIAVVYFIIVYFIPQSLVHPMVYIHPIFRVVDFVLGILLWRLYSLSCHQIDTIMNKVSSELLLTGCIVVSVFSLMIYPSVSFRYGYASLYWLPSMLLILVFTVLSDKKGKIARFFQSPSFVYLGKLSFPFYMLHQIVIAWWHSFADAKMLPRESFLGVFLCILFSFLMAHLYIKNVEPIVIRRLNG